MVYWVSTTTSQTDKHSKKKHHYYEIFESEQDAVSLYKKIQPVRRKKLLIRGS